MFILTLYSISIITNDVQDEKVLHDAVPLQLGLKLKNYRQHSANQKT